MTGTFENAAPVCRSLPIGTLMQMLGNQSGGTVNASNIHQTLGNLFGDDASPMLTQLASVAIPVRQ